MFFSLYFGPTQLIKLSLSSLFLLEFLGDVRHKIIWPTRCLTSFFHSYTLHIIQHMYCVCNYFLGYAGHSKWWWQYYKFLSWSWFWQDLWYSLILLPPLSEWDFRRSHYTCSMWHWILNLGASWIRSRHFAN